MEATILTADRKTWPLERVHVDLQMQSEGSATQIKRNIALTGALTDEQKQRLLQVANTCPVHKLLTGAIAIDTLIISLK